MAWTTDLLTGVAEHLAAAAVGTWNPDPAAVYPDDVVAIVLGRAPTRPDQALILNTYPVRGGVLSDVTQGIQVRCRGPATPDIRPVTDLADAVHQALHGAHDLTLGGIPVARVVQASRAWIGADENGREEITVNLYAETAQPSDHVTD